MEIFERFTKNDLAAIVGLLLIALFLRIPFVSSGLPFFYQEDEAHHFNRVVNMVKSGSYNPDYFHKPSLHFYLRMPVVAASFLWGVKEGHLKKLEDIKTKDNFGVGDYAFTVSHEGIVKWNRAFSLLLSLILICLTYILSRQLLGATSAIIPFSASLPAVLSPDLVMYSSYIGVDILMALFCAAAISSVLYVRQHFSLKALFLCGILSGLAVSSKYNALPIVILPLIVSISAKSFDWRSVAVALFSPVLGFLLGSPFALVSLPLFLNQLAYEIWHYGVQGHEGHMAEPGLPQVLFYMKWLGKSALGYGLLISSIIGLLVLVCKRDLKGKIFIIFPLLFIAQMCMQKANFERNMLVVVPLLGIVSIVGIDWMLRAMKLGERKVYRLILLMVILFSIQPALQALQLRNEAKVLPESRRELAVYLESLSRNNLRIGLAGQLQMPPQIYSLGGTNKIDQMKISSGEFDLTGFDVIVVHGPVAMTGAIFDLEKEFPGEVGPQRVVRNPLIQVYRKRRGN